MTALDAEDSKLVMLALSVLSRATGAREGAAVRDEIGRTYVAASVSLGALQLGALELAIAMASSSGVRRLDAAAVVTGRYSWEPDPLQAEVLAAVGNPRVIVADSQGAVLAGA